MSSPKLADWARLHVLERKRWLWLLLLITAVSAFVLGWFVAYLWTRNTLPREFETLVRDYEEQNNHVSEDLFSHQELINETRRLARKVLTDTQALHAFVISTNLNSLTPTRPLGRLLGLQTTSYQARSQKVVAGAHSLCALQRVQHGPHGESVACQLRSIEGRWVLNAKRAQCSWICLN